MANHVGTDFAEKHGSDLVRFAYEALQYGYGKEASAEDDVSKVSNNGITTVNYEKGCWSFVDSFSNGEPFSGMSTIFYKGICCWSLIYFGGVYHSVTDASSVYECLFKALLAAPNEHLFRGPREYADNNGLRYFNDWRGNAKNFDGLETICNQYSEYQFSLYYKGGLVNLR